MSTDVWLVLLAVVLVIVAALLVMAETPMRPKPTEAGPKVTRPGRPSARRQRILAMHADGMSAPEIAAILQVTKQAVGQHLRASGIFRADPARAAQASRAGRARRVDAEARRAIAQRAAAARGWGAAA